MFILNIIAENVGQFSIAQVISQICWKALFIAASITVVGEKEPVSYHEILELFPQDTGDGCSHNTSRHWLLWQGPSEDINVPNFVIDTLHIVPVCLTDVFRFLTPGWGNRQATECPEPDIARQTMVSPSLDVPCSKVLTETFPEVTMFSAKEKISERVFHLRIHFLTLRLAYSQNKVFPGFPRKIRTKHKFLTLEEVVFQDAKSVIKLLWLRRCFKQVRNKRMTKSVCKSCKFVENSWVYPSIILWGSCLRGGQI